jgi:hypothetical protein
MLIKRSKVSWEDDGVGSLAKKPAGRQLGVASS